MNDTEKNMNTNIEHIKKICFWKSAFFGLIILVAGIVIGGASMSIVETHKLTTVTPNREYETLMPRLRQSLGLSQEQANKIRPSLDEHMQHLQELRENARVEIINTLDQMNSEISSLLNERQKRIWQSELIRIQRDLNPERPRGGGGGAGRRRGQDPTNQGIRRRRGQQSIGTNQRLMEPQLPPPGPNSFLNDVNRNEIIKRNIDSNNAFE